MPTNIAQPNEQALRALVKFFNQKHYGTFAPLLHRRSSSSMHGHGHNDNPNSNHPPPSPSANFGLEDSFPPARTMTSFGHNPAFRSSYIPESLADSYLEDYEQILGDLLTPRYSVDVNGVPSLYPDGSGAQAESVWHRLGEILGETDDISDSESVGSIGYLNFGEGSESGSDDSGSDLRPEWSDMSPDIISALEEERDSIHGSPRSPRPRRGSSEPKSPALRPVLALDPDEDVCEAVSDDMDDEFGGPALASPHTGPAGSSSGSLHQHF